MEVDSWSSSKPGLAFHPVPKPQPRRRAAGGQPGASQGQSHPPLPSVSVAKG